MELLVIFIHVDSGTSSNLHTCRVELLVIFICRVELLVIFIHVEWNFSNLDTNIMGQKETVIYSEVLLRVAIGVGKGALN